jgi:hypothetical protein
MLRRNVNMASGPDSGDLPAAIGSTGTSAPNKILGASSPRLGRTSSRDSLPQRNVEFCSTRVLLVVAALVTAATYMFPADVRSVEHQAYQAEQELEREMFDWWQKGEHKPPVPMKADAMEMDTDSIPLRSKETATEAMLQQDSKWVDGEKKLKQKLKVLAARQAEGKDLGVPVLTRYLGEEMPAWAGEGVNVDEWQKKVAAKYDEMRVEEEEWKKEMQVIIDREKRG